MGELGIAEPNSTEKPEDQCLAMVDPYLKVRRYLPISLDGCKTTAYLDHGSDISAIDPDICRRMVAEDKVQTAHFLLKGPDGPILARESALLEVDYGAGKCTELFYVLPHLPMPVLIGAKFMKTIKLHILTETDEVQIDGINLPLSSASVPFLSPRICLMEDADYIRDSYTIDFDCKPAYLEMLYKYADVFDRRPGKAKGDPIRILTGTAPPVREPSRPKNAERMKREQKYVQEMLDMGIIEPSNSPWAANIVLAAKKDTAEERPCVDFRRLNDITLFNAYPMPRVDDILTIIGQAKIFTTVDMTKGFMQIAVHPDDRQKTAFHAPDGLFQFVRMPFGLKCAPAVYQQMMNNAYRKILNRSAVIYIDDVVIFSSTVEEHLAHLRQFLDLTREAGLTINPKKIQPLKNKIKILGHIIFSGGVMPDPEKIEGIQKFPVPKDKTGVQSFLGSINYYSQFIPHVAQITAPLYKLTRNNVPFVFGPEEYEAFEKAKDAMVGLVLNTPKLNEPFLIQCDGSGLGLGAVLMQEGYSKDGKHFGWMPVSFRSRVLHGAESNYQAQELECLALIWAVKKFRPFIEYTKFTIETDHLALKWLQTFKEPRGRLARWMMELQTFNFEIRYRPGKANRVADALSRYPVSKDDDDCVLALEAEEEEIIASHFRNGNFPLANDVTLDEVADMQRKEPLLNNVILFLKNARSMDKELSKLNPTDRGAMLRLAENSFVTDTGLLTTYHNPGNYGTWDDKYNWERIVAPRELVPLIMSKYHDDPLAGHSGADKTYDKINRHFYWPVMHNDVAKYVHSCDKCQKCNPPNAKPMGLMKIADHVGPWEKVSVDIIGPLPKSTKGNTYLLVFLDTFSGWIECFPLREAAADAMRCADKALTVFCRWGFPRMIVSDNGPQFASKVWTDVMKKLGVKAVFTTPYHPQANPVERANRNIKNYVTKYAADNHRRWDEQIEQMQFALRTTVNKSTKLTPARALLGKELLAPADLVVLGKDFAIDFDSTVRDYARRVELGIKNSIKYCLENRGLASQQQKIYYDNRHRFGEFKIGDLVLYLTKPISSAAKGIAASLTPKLIGPLRITGKLNPNNYTLGQPDTGEFARFAHVVQLKPYYARDDTSKSPDSLDDADAYGAPTISPPVLTTPPVPVARIGLGAKRGRKKKSPNDALTTIVAPPATSHSYGTRSQSVKAPT